VQLVQLTDQRQNDLRSMDDDHEHQTRLMQSQTTALPDAAVQTGPAQARLVSIDCVHALPDETQIRQQQASARLMPGVQKVQSVQRQM
jgi:hypothetical protein